MGCYSPVGRPRWRLQFRCQLTCFAHHWRSGACTIEETAAEVLGEPTFLVRRHGFRLLLHDTAVHRFEDSLRADHLKDNAMSRLLFLIAIIANQNWLRTGPRRIRTGKKPLTKIEPGLLAPAFVHYIALLHRQRSAGCSSIAFNFDKNCAPSTPSIAR